MLTDNEVFKIVQKRWLKMDKRISRSQDQLYNELVAKGLESDEAFEIVSLAIVRNLFFRQLIAWMVRDFRDEKQDEDYRQKFLDWIAREWDDWDKEAESDDEP